MTALNESFDQRFPGFEFDWFAADIKGNLGLFSSAGFGPVPSSVQAHFQDHDRMTSHIELPNWNSPEIWKDYAWMGLYVFDWQHWQGPYLKMGQPFAEMDAAFKQQILEIPNLIIFNVAFEQVKSMDIQGDVKS